MSAFGRHPKMGQTSPADQCAICNKVTLFRRVCQCPGDPHRYEVHHRQSCADAVVDRTFQRSAAHIVEYVHKGYAYDGKHSVTCTTPDILCH